ncbi:MAG: hypothetical protein JW889_12340 [Verrucomicrobia bacterium]|nr:hypothetical protein [Verrucomicrobiota bacterium]
MRGPHVFPAALLAAAIAVALAAGCLGRTSRDDVRYYRTVARSRAGLRQGEEPITSRQAATQEHWRVIAKGGRTVRLAHHDASGTLVEEIRIVYDAGGRVAEENTHDADGRIEESLAFSSDAEGRVTGFSRRTAAGGLVEQRQWNYDSQGRPKELRAFGPRGIQLWRDKFVYDPDHPAKWLGVRRFSREDAPPTEIPAANYSFWD